MTEDGIPSSACTRRPDEIGADGFSSLRLARNNFPAARGGGGGAQRAAAALSDGFGSGPTGLGPTDEHSFHLHHRDFTVTPITDQIGPMDSVFKTECYDLKNHFSEPQYKMTVLPLNIGKSRFDLC
ncbi:hypothetical protein F511_43085 [Dorcoceras hygrometricum]|uniref:Uncharacterized protein n=1 Tax=Dorcoceras hygrometricum TaxID=472368 RepID=A0A2Z7CPZ5_9LAMI|nr:hypothetical protein F511_43085 [Dorcoceras hygrometricum]